MVDTFTTWEFFKEDTLINYNNSSNLIINY